MMIKYAQAHRVPWANGRGHTSELVSWERSRAHSPAGTPAWRLSIAELEGPAAFSTIPASCATSCPSAARSRSP